jgi:multiple sugar transport system permease protein
MTIGKAIRWLLVWGAGLVVIWSFVSVVVRLWHEHDPRDHRTQLVVLHWGDASETAIVEQMVKEYESAHPNIKILRIQAKDYDSKIKTMLAAGTPPDVFYMDYSQLPEYAHMGLLANLDPHIAELAGGQNWLDGFYPVLLDAFRYDGKLAGKGPLYGIPKDFTPILMYVNCDLFKKAGIPIPYGGWTWEEFEADCKKISSLPPDAAGRNYGAALNTWPLVLENILQTFGGDIFDKGDFREMTIDSPESVKALEMIQRMRFVDKTVYPAAGTAASDANTQLFFTGKVAALGPVGRWATPHFRGTGPGDPGITSFDWDVVPLPHGKNTVSDIAVVAWVMSSTTKHPAEAFDLLHFLTGPGGQSSMAKLGLAVPSIKEVAKSDAFMVGKPAHTQLFLDMVKYGKISPIPPQREYTQDVTDVLGAAIELNEIPASEAATKLKERWHEEMSSPLKSREYPLMKWGVVSVVTGVVVIAVVGVGLWLSSRQKMGLLDRKMERTGWLFVSPWVIGFVFLTLGPMVVSLLLSLTKWSGMTPMGQAEYVGFDNFAHLANFDQDIGASLRVTVYYALLMVPLTQIAALAIAMLMTTKVRGMTAFRTMYYIPTLVGGVTMGTIWMWLFDKDYGLVNHALTPIARIFGTTPPDWLHQDAARWAVPVFVMMALWTVGGGMLTYLAALKNVPGSLYEAARIDGAGFTRQFFAVTLPMISPLVLFNVIMAIIASFQVFTQAFVMTNGGPKNLTLFYVLYLYRQAFQFENMGYASALAWLLFVMVLVLTGLLIRSSRSWVYYEGLKA